MIFVQLFLSFFKVGLLGFGGGLAIVRLIYDSIQPFMNMSREAFANIVAISQITPGPLAVNTATYVGFEAAGILGSLAATTGVVLPAFIIVSIICRTLQKFKDSKWVQGAMTGIRPAVMGLIASAAATLVAPSLAGEGRLGCSLIGALSGTPVDIIAVVIMLTTVVVMAKFKKSPFILLVIMGIIGALLGA